MRRLIKKIAGLPRRDEGATAIEYAFMLMLIVVVCLTAIALFGDATARTFQDSNDQIESAVSVSDAGEPAVRPALTCDVL